MPSSFLAGAFTGRQVEISTHSTRVRLLTLSAVITVSTLFAGCAAGYQLHIPPVADYSSIEKFDMKVRLDIPPEFRRYLFYGGTALRSGDTKFLYGVLMGELFDKNARGLTHALFREVLVREDTAPSNWRTVDAILTPKVKSVNMKLAWIRFGDGNAEIELEWVLADLQGNEIWRTTSTGMGHYPLGWGGREAPINERVRLAMDQSMRKTHAEAAASTKIRGFVASVKNREPAER